jgi:hypothetical protein
LTTAENCMVPPVGTKPPPDESTIDAGVLGPVELSFPPHADNDAAMINAEIAKLIRRAERGTTERIFPAVAMRTAWLLHMSDGASASVTFRHPLRTLYPQWTRHWRWRHVLFL